MLSLSQETPLDSTGIYASDTTVSPLSTGQAIQFGSMVTHPAGATLSPAAQQAIGLHVDTTSIIKISDGVASEAERQAAQQMFNRRTQKQGSQKRHDPGLMKKLKMSVGIFLGLLLFGGLMLVVAAPNDQTNTYNTDGIAHNESEARNSITNVPKLAPPQPTPPHIWNWVAGGSQGNQNGVYYGSGAWPGSRSYATRWTVSHANGQVDLYMFGGVGCDSVTSGSEDCGDLGFAHNPDNLDAAADSGCEF